MELTDTERKETAKAIMQGLGGRKFTVMTGARDFGALPCGGVIFKYPRAKYCKITYDRGLDLFDMTLAGLKN